MENTISLTPYVGCVCCVDAEGRPGGGGLMLFAAEDYAAAMEIVLCDPLIANDCVDCLLNETREGGWE